MIRGAHNSDLQPISPLMIVFFPIHVLANPFVAASKPSQSGQHRQQLKEITEVVVSPDGAML